MKIVDITITKPLYLDLVLLGDARGVSSGPRAFNFLCITTDEGVTGLCPTWGPSPDVNVFALAIFKPLVVGMDPFEVEKIWEKCYWTQLGSVRRGAPMRALSYIDIAIWDIIGKACKQPIHRLLGGHRTKVAAYGSGININFTLEELVEQSRSFVKDGFKAVKMKIGRRDAEEILERVKAVRDAVGLKVALMVDANNGWSVQTAIKMARRLERYDVYWLEEPIIADDIEGYAKLCASTDVPIATGESHYTKYEFKELIERKAVDIVQADVTKVGGITEWMKVAAIAEAWGLPMAPHAISQIHTPLVAAIPNGLIVECIRGFVARKPLWRDPIIPKDGYVECIDKPGLGLEIDEAVVKEYRAKPVALGGFSTTRGSNWPPFL